MLISITSFIQILTNKLKEQNSNITAKPGSVIHDTFVIPTATAMAWTNANTTLAQVLTSLDAILQAQNDEDFKIDLAESLSLSLDTVNELLTNSIDKLAANYGLVRKIAQKAYGIAYFYVSSVPVNDITVSSGVILETSQKVQFETTSEVILQVSSIENLYDPTLNAYVVEVPIRAIEYGPASNVDADSLVYTESPLVDFDGVTNKFAISTGYNLETDAEFIDRIKVTFKGINLETKDGFEALILNNTAVRSIFIADAQSEYQLRNDGNGGVVDIYTADSIPAVVTETLVYNELDHVLIHQPALDILSVIQGATTFTEGVDYKFTVDTNILVAGSTQALNKLEWLVGGTKPTVGVEYTIEYVYNQHISDIDTLVNSDEYRPLMGDITTAVLVREGVRVPIDIGYTIVVYADYSRTDVLNRCAVAIQNYVNSLTFGASIAQSDIINILEDIPGVNYVDTTPLAFNRQDQAEIQSVIYSLAYEYLRTGVITLR